MRRQDSSSLVWFRKAFRMVLKEIMLGWRWKSDTSRWRSVFSSFGLQDLYGFQNRLL